MKPSDLLSHPDKFLEKHISQVYKTGKSLLENEKIDDEILKDILTIIIFSHDIGKSTSFFQEYIRGEKSFKNKPETKHSLLGGIIGFYLTERYLKSKNIESPFLSGLSFVLPKRHHSDLKYFYEDLILSDEEIEVLKNQINSIDREKFKAFFENLQMDNKKILSFSFEEINLEEIQQKLKKLRRFFRKINKEKDLNYYITTALLFSYLVDADKSDVVLDKSSHVLFKEINLPENLVENFIKSKNFEENEINKLRTQALNEVLEKEIDLNNKIYSLTLPTGMGKTLTSLAFALKLSKKLEKEKGINPKIIYSLPFLSIIEQNFKVFEDVLKENGIKTDSLRILKHHHLSDFKYRYEDNEFDYDSSRILVEGWNSKIVVTTFIQLFHTLIGYKNKALRKFHRFTNSIIILDEIQSIPFKYWLVIKEVIKSLANRFNFYVIFSTATQPLIFKENETVPLVRHTKYFQKFNRYKIVVNKEQKSLDEFLKGINLDTGKRYLFIANTIKQATKIYEQFKDKNPVFLSTYIVPVERAKRIKKLKEENTKLAITTQIVEAGVDIDFDVVYRDFAPLDSIIQSAGRCNREGKKEQGEIYVFKTLDEKNRLFSSYIYDTTLLTATDDIFVKGEYEEKEVLELVNKYFQTILKRKSQDESYKLLEYLYSLKFSGEREPNEILSVADFKLIEKEPYKSDVFVQIDKEAVKVWEEFKKIMQIKEIFERRKAFDSIKSKFYNYIISVPVQDNIPPVENGFYYVPYENLEDYYDIETGFKMKNGFFMFCKE
ncbi:MAG: CRISPR-associated helicase Cas3' [Persephonella sp.]|nr:CRISPR-associated helicase Cas3' [Persephonella sp.]